MPKNPKRPYRRRRPRKRNNRNKSQYQVAKRAARQVAYGMIPIKRVPNDGTLTLDSNDPNSILIKPYFIEANATLSSGADEMHKRNGNQIYVQRTSGIFRIQPPATCVNVLQVRHVCGWYKGSGATLSAGQGPTGLAHSLTAAHINEVFHTNLARYDPANFKIVHDSTFSKVPESIYDLNGSDDNYGDEAMVAIWKPITVKCNFKFNKRFKYADGKQGDDSEISTSGEELVGWKPFVWLGVKAPQQQWSQANPLAIEYKFTTYFKDLN